MNKENHQYKRFINNQYLAMGFNIKGIFIGTNLHSAYHSIINVPYCVPRTKGPKGKIHSFVYYVVRGSIKFMVKDKEIIVEENHVFFGLTTPDIIMLDNGNEAEFFSLYFAMFNYNLPLYTPFPIQKREKDVNALKKVLKYLNEQSNLNIGSANAIFPDLLFSWLRHCKTHESSQLPYGQMMLDAQLYISEHIEEKLLVSDIAAQFNFSEPYFRKLFTQVIGESPKQYIDKLKLERAFVLLMETDLSVSEIADKLNYSSSHHFSNNFKKAYNLSPSESRHSHSNH